MSFRLLNKIFEFPLESCFHRNKYLDMHCDFYTDVCDNTNAILLVELCSIKQSIFLFQLLLLVVNLLFWLNWQNLDKKLSPNFASYILTLEAKFAIFKPNLFLYSIIDRKTSRYQNLTDNLLNQNLNNWYHIYQGRHEKHSGGHFLRDL